MRKIKDIGFEEELPDASDLVRMLDAGAGGEVSAALSVAGPFASSGSSADGPGSFAFGEGVSAAGRSFACGNLSRASGDTSFACGFRTGASEENAFACGNQTSAAGRTSFAAGYGTLAAGDDSFACGDQTSAMQGPAFAAGYMACASSDMAFCWAGTGSPAGDSGPGTFCVWPRGGADGFFVGGRSLREASLAALSSALSGEEMPADPDPDEAAEALRKVFRALGGRVV